MALTDVKSEQIQSSVALAGSPTTTTQSASDNSTKIATTAYVETAVANLVASAPSALNTLDELAAALNDDASFSTTVTNSIATKLPLAGGTLTGALVGTKASFDTASTTDYALRLTDNGVADYDVIFPDTSTYQLTTNTTSDKTFKLLNSGSGTFNLNVEGKVGIGSGATSPASLLHVDGAHSGGPIVTIHQTAGSTSADSGLDVETSSTGTYVQRWINSGTELARVTGTGRLGIGTNSPSGLAHVYNGMLQVGSKTGDTSIQQNANAIRIAAVPNSSTEWGGLQWYREFSDVIGAEIIAARASSTEADTDLIFKTSTNSSNAVEALRIEHDGGIRIGTGSYTNSQYYASDVVLNAANEGGLTIASSANTHGSYIMFADGVSSGSEQYAGYIEYNHNADRMRLKSNGDFLVYGVSLGADALAVKSDGKVGIGTSSPGAALDIETAGNTADGTYYSTITINNTGSSTYSRLRFDRSASARWGIGLRNDDKFHIAKLFNTSSDDTFVIDSGGKVGIGTASPAGLLTIRGTGDAIRVESTNAGTGGAQLDLLHHTASPADNDTPGSINFGGYYSGTTPAYSAAVRSIWTDVSAREGKLAFLTREGSTFDERLTITHKGYVQKPAQPYIRCGGNSGSMVTNQGTVTEPFTNWQVATNRGITLSSGIFTVPVAGEYLITYSFYFWVNNSGNGVSHSVLLKHGNSTVQEVIYETGSSSHSYLDNTKGNSIILNMAAGDTFKFRVYADVYGGYTHTNMSAYLLG